MGEKRYILLRPDEDGNPITWVDSEELDDIKGLIEDYNIKRFLTDVPRNPDPNYWVDGDALLLEVKVRRVVAVTVVEKYEIR